MNNQFADGTPGTRDFVVRMLLQQIAHLTLNLEVQD